MTTTTATTTIATLREQLAARLAQFRQNAPAETVALIEQSNEALARSGQLDDALGVGDTAPDFTLVDHLGQRFELAAALTRGPVILTFYRGGWCPYCNLELRAYQQALGDIVAVGAQLVAVTPETPDQAMSTAEKNAIGFPVLTDPGLGVARRFGIVFEMPPALQALYTRLGHALPQVNGDDSWALPMPATFVIGGDSRILLASVDADYRERLEPADAVAALRRPA